MVVGYITLLVTSSTLYLMYVHKRTEELSVLRSLFQHLNHIKLRAGSQKKQMEKLRLTPTWTLSELDLNYYLRKINFKVREENRLNYHPTKELKEAIIFAYDQINKINNIFNLIYITEASSMNQDEKVLRIANYHRELLGKPYYQELIDAIDLAHSELKKILKPVK